MIKNTTIAAIRWAYNIAQAVMQAITPQCFYQPAIVFIVPFAVTVTRILVELTAGPWHEPNRFGLLISNSYSDLNLYQVTASIIRHLFDTWHLVDLEWAFWVIKTSVMQNRLKFLEASLINTLKLVLCAHRNLSLTMNLSWFYLFSVNFNPICTNSF